jgi:uncharacterized hydrophobic protein (TIGR00271 family)
MLRGTAQGNFGTSRDSSRLTTRVKRFCISVLWRGNKNDAPGLVGLSDGGILVPAEAEKPMKFKLNWRLNEKELSPQERREVLEDLFVFGKQNQGPFLARMTVLLVLSTFIATAGLLSDSSAVVIGAMLVAPMMNPVLSAAGAVVMGWSSRFYGAIWLVLSMGAGAVILSMLITLLSPEIVFLPEQVLARTRPTFYDLLIALAAGSAGAYTITRKETSAIPGVAVAVALLPPLASAGILIMTGYFELALRASVLFLTNLVAMVLAGAVTFIAVGVSPASARKHSADFIKSKLWLFFVLVIAVSVPLYFYSEKIIFNAHYRAAKSESLQSWLRENDLQLTDVEILLEDRTIYLELEGPNPPVSIKNLYDRLTDDLARKGIENSFTIQYTWTQKVSGAWPLESASITEVAADARQGDRMLIANDWAWQFTQYDAERGSRPAGENDYIVSFDDKGKVSVAAPCGTVKGKFKYRGKSLTVEMRKFNWFKCRDEPELEVFLGDLERGTDIFIDGEQLQISLATNSGVMYFRKYPN